MTTLGPGRRAGVWFQGCSIRCAGCVSRDTWPATQTDQLVPVDDVVRWLVRAAQEGIEGITLTGGEPLDQDTGLLALLVAVHARRELRHVDVLLYSGFSNARLQARHGRVLELVDAVMSGPYVEALPTELPWRGSSNQRLDLLTDRARRRFGTPGADRRLQVSGDDGTLWVTGIPRRGDLDRFEELLALRGVRLGGATWKP